MQNNIVNILADADDYVSRYTISNKLGISRQTVRKSIDNLRKRGYEFEFLKRLGYKLTAFPDSVDVGVLKLLLNNKIIGKSILVLDSVDSTNDYIKRIGNSRAANGTVVVAREQKNGKGRLGRSWQSKKDESIMLSILLKPNITPSQVSQITPLVGLAVCKALREVTKLNCMIKWPNDIVVGSKKLVGILTEMSTERDSVEYIVTGIGINVDQTDFPDEIAHKATSILLETGKHFDKNRLLINVLEQLEKEFSETNLELTPDALEQYVNMCISIGKSVRFMRGTRQMCGTAVDVAVDGQLQVVLPDGSPCLVNSGEVTVQGIY